MPNSVKFIRHFVPRPFAPFTYFLNKLKKTSEIKVPRPPSYVPSLLRSPDPSSLVPLTKGRYDPWLPVPEF